MSQCLESAQAMQPGRAFRYADPAHGKELRTLLKPARTKAVVAAYYDSVLKGNTEPDVLVQIRPMLDRYDKAFTGDPRNYEEEYLDTLTITAEVLKLGTSMPAARVGSQPGATAEESALSKQLISSLTQLNNSFRVTIANGIFRKLAKGMFSVAGMGRAIALANAIGTVNGKPQSAAGNARPGDKAQTRQVYSGAEVYQQDCVACHATGAAGAPRFGNAKDWAARIKSSQAMLLNAALHGKGAMPPMSGIFYDLEIERAVVYMANSAGGNYVEPALPAGHPGLVAARPASGRLPPF